MRFVRARIHRQNDGLPAELRQVLNEAQRALDTAASRQRRKVVRDHQHPPRADGSIRCPRMTWGRPLRPGLRLLCGVRRFGGLAPLPDSLQLIPQRGRRETELQCLVRLSERVRIVLELEVDQTRVVVGQGVAVCGVGRQLQLVTRVLLPLLATRGTWRRSFEPRCRQRGTGALDRNSIRSTNRSPAG